VPGSARLTLGPVPSQRDATRAEPNSLAAPLETAHEARRNCDAAVGGWGGRRRAGSAHLTSWAVLSREKVIPQVEGRISLPCCSGVTLCCRDVPPGRWRLPMTLSRLFCGWRLRSRRFSPHGQSTARSLEAEARRSVAPALRIVSATLEECMPSVRSVDRARPSRRRRHTHERTCVSEPRGHSRRLHTLKHDSRNPVPRAVQECAAR
jgi:hypothetical protein